MIFIRTLSDLDTKKLNFWQLSPQGEDFYLREMDNLFSNEITDEEIAMETKPDSPNMNEHSNIEHKCSLSPTSYFDLTAKFIDEKRWQETIDYITRSM